MIGTKSTAEAADVIPFMRDDVVEERSIWSEAGGEPTVDRMEVIMRTLVTKSPMKIRTAVILRFPGECSSTQG